MALTSAPTEITSRDQFTPTEQKAAANERVLPVRGNDEC